VSELLEEADHPVVGIADTGTSALKQAAHSRPDLALVDIKLGNEDEDGVRTALRLKERHPLKVVFVSGHLVSLTQRRAAEAEPAGLLKITFLLKARTNALRRTIGSA
jgi:DNA-binding NarL/FixJ family response regulator